MATIDKPSSQNVDACKVFELEKSHLSFGGFYPVNLTIKRFVVQIFVLLISWWQFLAMSTFLFFQISNLTKVSEILLFCMTQFAFLCKLTNFIRKKRNMMIVEDVLRKEIFRKLSVEEQTVFEADINSCRVVATVFRILCIFVVLFYGMFPFLDQSQDGVQKYPLPCWFPFDPSRYYYQVLFGEVLSIAVGAWCNSTIDILSITLITVGATHFRILAGRIRDIPTHESGAEDGGECQRRLVHCVVYYNELLRYVDIIEDTFSYGIFVQFFCSVIVICLTGFQMIVIPIYSMQFVLLITYFCCMMCQVIVYCWYGHNIMETSSFISEACYSTRWNEFDIRSQKMLMLVMERAKRPALLTAGNFFALNLATLMTILRSSYSYFAVLQRLYVKNNSK